MGGPGSRKSFGVEVQAGRLMAGWPFGRLDIGDDELAVRALFPWIQPRSASKQAVGEIFVYSRFGFDHLMFMASTGALAGVRLGLTVRSRRIRDELSSRGYSVIDQRKSGFSRVACFDCGRPCSPVG